MDWNKIKVGDDDAWIDASKDLLPVAKRAAKGQCPELSDDETQSAAVEALHEMIDGIDDISSEENLWARLITCAERRAIDQVRRKGRKKNFLVKADSIDADQIPGHDPLDERTKTASEELKYTELRMVAAHVLQEFDTKDVEFLTDYYFVGLSQREIAEEQGWDPKQFTNRLDQILKRVHKRLCSDDRFKEFCASFP